MVRHTSTTNTSSATSDQQPQAEGRANRNWPILILVLVFAIALALVLARTIGTGKDKPTGSGPGGDPGMVLVNSLAVDPADGTLYAATHTGVFRVPASKQAARIAGRYQDTSGFVIPGPRHFLASGHPDPRENKPGRLGLIESTDAAQTWHSVSLDGRADFHTLRAAHGHVYGFDAATARFMVTQDLRTWDSRSVTPMLDFDVSPDVPDTILAATSEYGLARSSDGGRSFATVKNSPPLAVLSWPAANLLYGATPAGAVMASTDGGNTWEQRGSLDGQPTAIVAQGKQTLHAATASGIYTSSDGGRSFRRD
ncbi:hypothetical protein JOF29_000070 [Kribbella aluminosa]|uniref:Exo-alpha-sialidase n=1 Tax=Kribbella aluminosa TaxID=416017 RepID=A0ABS4UBG7_9ACTN|nr:exo-alpha-sialidase [Kribbella aluminosa]MBP2348987.1 hypothetical protein [Kribbella aluminosa]